MRRLFLLLLIAITACYRYRPVEYIILPYPTGEAFNAYAKTTCSWNNLPLILADTSTLLSPYASAFIKHEVQHADDILAYTGGCWPFVHRYDADSAFKRLVEYRAYCAEGREAIKNNRHPIDVWNRLKSSMLLYGMVLTEQQNCLFDSSYLHDSTGLNRPTRPPDTLDR